MQQSKAVRITGTADARSDRPLLRTAVPEHALRGIAAARFHARRYPVHCPPHWENFIDAWNMANITPLLLNSCILVIVVVPCVVIFCSLGGYAFAQLKVPCKGLIYVLFLVGLTIPFETLVTPLYYEISGMGLLNTVLP